MALTVRLPHEFAPRAYQQEYMSHYDHGGRGGVFVWHRRAGKDLVALHQTAKMAHERVGMYWHCLPTYAQARKAVWNNFMNDGRRTIRSVFPKQIVRHPDEFRPQAEMLIELKNGSMISIIGSDSIDNIVGAGPCHVTFSEYALCKPNSYGLVRPMLRESNGTVSFITTPRGKNHAWDIWETAGKAKGWLRTHQPLTVTEAWRTWRDDEGRLFDSAQAVLDAEAAAGMQPELVRQEYLCDWTAALVGSVYGDLMERLEKQGWICEFQHDGGGVFFVWDLGRNDSTAYWILEHVNNELRLIDHYESHGKGLSHYFEKVDEVSERLGLKVVKHWLPHDSRAMTLATDLSVREQFAKKYGWGKVDVVPKLDIIDGIQAARWFLQQNVRIHSRCNKHLGIEALKQYHYEFDEVLKTFANRPEHDWSSHTADAFRYLALVTKTNIRLSKPAKPVEPPKPLLRSINSFTMDEIWKIHEDSLLSRSRRRIS